jgi:hypothetical protein
VERLIDSALATGKIHHPLTIGGNQMATTDETIERLKTQLSTVTTHYAGKLPTINPRYISAGFECKLYDYIDLNTQLAVYDTDDGYCWPSAAQRDPKPIRKTT